MKKIGLILSTLIAFMPLVSLANDEPIKLQSAYDIENTVLRFTNKATEMGLKIFYTMAHDKEASKVGQSLAPTRLIIFGSPKVGTALMQCNQSVGIDLPLKALIWQDKTGNVYLSYTDMSIIEAQHSLTQCNLPLNKIANNLLKIATFATVKAVSEEQSN